MPAPFSPLLIGADTPPPEEQGYRPTINPLVIPATQTPSLAEGWQGNFNALSQWYRDQQQKSYDLGLADPETGWPTPKGTREAATAAATNLVMGSVAPKGVADRISTRVPTAVGQTIDPHSTADLRVGLDSSRASGEAYAKNADIINGYSDVPTQRLRNADSISEKLVNHVQENLTHLHDAMPPEIRARAMQWYDGANTIAHDWAQKYGLSPRATAGTLASLSPQKDWFQNVDLARRVIETRASQGNTRMTPEMDPHLQRYVDMQKVPVDRERLQATVDDFRRGKPLGDITDPREQAMWIRAFDEAHNPRSYPIITPEGGTSGTAVTGTGAPQRIGWGSFNEIAKANSVLNNDSLPNISSAMGGNHKVRNFYNNIIAPNAPHGDVTIDTHAIAAGHMRPLAGSDPEVSAGLGLTGSSSAQTGSRGLYGLYAEGYRRAAAQAGILPRQMQSVTWEGVRGLFSPEQKRNVKFVADMKELWSQYGKGTTDARTTRERVSQAAGGINPPEWWRPGP